MIFFYLIYYTLKCQFLKFNGILFYKPFKLVYHGNLSKHHIMFISMSIAHFNYVSQLFTYNPKIIYFIYNICKIVFIKLHIFFFTLMVIYFQIFNRTYRTLKFHVQISLSFLCICVASVICIHFVDLYYFQLYTLFVFL